MGRAGRVFGHLVKQVHPLVLQSALFFHQVQSSEKLVPETSTELVLGRNLCFQVVTNGSGTVDENVVVNERHGIAGFKSDLKSWALARALGQKHPLVSGGAFTDGASQPVQELSFQGSQRTHFELDPGRFPQHPGFFQGLSLHLEDLF